MRTYAIKQACRDVAVILAEGNDHGATTIRCTLNDYLDSLSKEGYRVNFGYDQDLAVKRVKRTIKGLRGEL